MTHQDLVNIAYKWTLKRCGVAYKELRSINSEVPDVIGFRSGESLVVEVKISKSDFLRDAKKPHRITGGMGKFRFFLCPENMIKMCDLPAKWGLVYVNGKGRCEVVHNPYNPMGGNIWRNGFDVDLAAENRLMYSILRRNFIKE